MFAIVRTGGKQYRVAPGDKIVVDKMEGIAGGHVDLTDVLFAGNDGEAVGVAGLTVTAEVIAQAKAEKVIVFKKKRRHNYRRKNGHRQQHTILRILTVGGHGEQAVQVDAANDDMIDEAALIAAPMTAQSGEGSPVELSA